MGKRAFRHGALCGILSAFVISLLSCTGVDEEKMAITTSSTKAKDYYLQGRNLAENLQAQEARQYFEKAIAEDPDFALAYLNLALSQSTFKGFFEYLDKARSLADKVTEGERLWIQGIEAGNNAEPMKQREHYKKMVALLPNDERAHTLLATNYFGQQEYDMAIGEYNKAIEINPDFAPAYNMLGYSYRLLKNYEAAEKAFEKYIQLIPDDPNPYDSYAELLMIMGKYDASIESYGKALQLNPAFAPSHIGIATNLNYKEQHAEARKQLQKLHEVALNDGQRRAACFAAAVSYVDQGDFDNAMMELEKQYAFADKINDVAAMAADFNAMGLIYLETGKYDEAMAKYNQSVKLMEGSGLDKEVIDNAVRNHYYNAARVHLMKKDFQKARTNADEYSRQVNEINNPFQIRLSHELYGMIALEKKEYDKAIAELNQASLQNPYNLYRLALAYKAKGDKAEAKNFCEQAVKANSLNNMNYAFIRHKAMKMFAEM